MASTQTCQKCGAVIYTEHIDQGRAGRWAGQLLCTVCYAAKRGGGAATAPPAQAPGGAEPLHLEPVEVTPTAATPVAAAAAKARISPRAGESISLEDGPAGESSASKIQAIGQTRIHAERKEFKRKTTVTGQGATRVKTFHSKIQTESIEFMDNAINEWLDENPDVEVKFVTPMIGTMAGKFPEPNIILNIWY